MTSCADFSGGAELSSDQWGWEVVMGWTHIDTLRNYVLPPNKKRDENNVYGDKPEILQKATSGQIVPGN